MVKYLLNTIIRSIYEESGRKCDGGMQENLHAQVARACSPWRATMPTLIILDPPLLACKLRKSRFYSVASNRDAKRKTLKNETGGEVKKEGKKKTRREVEWNNEEERKSEKNGNVGERKWRKKKGGNLRDRGMEDGVQAWRSFPGRLETREFCILYVYLRYRGWRSRLRVYFFRQECFCSKRHVSKIVGSMLGGKGELWEIFTKGKRRCAMENGWEEVQRRNLKREALKGCVYARENERSAATMRILWRWYRVIKYETKGSKGWVKRAELFIFSFI